MSTEELRLLESVELLQKLEEKREELFKLRLNWSAGSLENPNQMRQARKEIARMLTVLRERELALELVENEEAKGDDN